MTKPMQTNVPFADAPNRNGPSIQKAYPKPIHTGFVSSNGKRMYYGFDGIKANFEKIKRENSGIEEASSENAQSSKPDVSVSMTKDSNKVVKGLAAKHKRSLSSGNINKPNNSSQLNSFFERDSTFHTSVPSKEYFPREGNNKDFLALENIPPIEELDPNQKGLQSDLPSVPEKEEQIETQSTVFEMSLPKNRDRNKNASMGGSDIIVKDYLPSAASFKHKHFESRPDRTSIIKLRGQLMMDPATRMKRIGYLFPKKTHETSQDLAVSSFNEKYVNESNISLAF